MSSAITYDRCVAIGDPLCYSLCMGPLLCGLLTGTTWTAAFLLTVVPMLTMPLEFCGCHVINHFSCKFLALLKLACSDLQFYESLMLGTSTLTGSIYLHRGLLWQDPGGCAADEVHRGLQMRSMEGRGKVFSTYMIPQDKITSDSDKIISMLYRVLTPMMNPLIYSCGTRT